LIITISLLEAINSQERDEKSKCYKAVGNFVSNPFHGKNTAQHVTLDYVGGVNNRFSSNVLRSNRIVSTKRGRDVICCYRNLSRT